MDSANEETIVTEQPTMPSYDTKESDNSRPQNSLLDNNDVNVAIDPRVKGNDTVIYLCSFCVITVTYK